MSGELFPSGTPLADGRFVVTKVIASGGQATTYEGIDKSNGTRVAIKRFSVRGASSWKEVELAEREARVLSGLSHPGLPKVVNHFEEAGALYLVLEFIDGATLDELRRTHRLSQEDVADYLLQLAEILDYLHGLSPPLVHRDIKPRNLIRRPTGEIVLVDFGSVRERLAPEGGSTVVGTFGYMAPEQFQGRAMPGSDVYGAAATALALLTGRDPDELPHQGLKIDVERALGQAVSSPLLRFLTAALEPNPDERPRSLRAALNAYGVDPRSRSRNGEFSRHHVRSDSVHSDAFHSDAFHSDAFHSDAMGGQQKDYAFPGTPPFSTPGYHRDRANQYDRRKARRERHEARAERRAAKRSQRHRDQESRRGLPHDAVDVETAFNEVLAIPEVRRALRIPVLGLVAVIFLVVLRIVLWAVLGIIVPRVLHVLQKVTGVPLNNAVRQTTQVGVTLRDQLSRVTGNVRQVESGGAAPRYRVATPDASRTDFQRLADDLQARAEEFESETALRGELRQDAEKK